MNQSESLSLILMFQHAFYPPEKPEVVRSQILIPHHIQQDLTAYYTKLLYGVCHGSPKYISKRLIYFSHTQKS